MWSRALVAQHGGARHNYGALEYLYDDDNFSNLVKIRSTMVRVAIFYKVNVH